MKKLVRIPDPRLREQSVDVVHPSHVGALVKDLKFFTRKLAAYGVAAPQIGVNKNVFVGIFGDDLEVVLNPRILSGEGSEIAEEGCLSIPKSTFLVDRHTSIRVSFMKPDTTTCFMELEGLEARIFQHEYDHLNGVLISDRALARG